MRYCFIAIACIVVSTAAYCQKKSNKNFAVIAYYTGNNTMIDSFPVEKLTHIIYSFAHLSGDSISLRNNKDSITLQHLVALKERNPKLKIMISLGGWGGCATCSDVFADEEQRKTFAQTVKQLLDYFHLDGIDLDWEYPATEGYPGHKYMPEDKNNFTALVKQLRHVLGKKSEISFAVGGSKYQIDYSYDWRKVMPLVNRVNLMSYDLAPTNFSSHHTALFSSAKQMLSADNGIQELKRLGVAAGKIVIGAAFYARVFASDTTLNNGLYQPAKFEYGVSFKNFDSSFSQSKGYKYYWDTVAQAPFFFNEGQRLFASFDDKTSVKLKTKYAIQNNLNGIMFWELRDDSFTNGLLDAINEEKQKLIKQ
ncbi:MAG: glycoside hydrolase family 18 protein [Bacteroidetes bacterium]|nr:glycoside hydrolase family 18 protein [Bacteroidota bacterium]MBS1757658.1 glycoside hydrolase family 18 protein [Bacteroidota bacterium]